MEQEVSVGIKMRHEAYGSLCRRLTACNFGTLDETMLPKQHAEQLQRHRLYWALGEMGHMATKNRGLSLCLELPVLVGFH